MSDENFLSRWSKRKREASESAPPTDLTPDPVQPANAPIDGQFRGKAPEEHRALETLPPSSDAANTSTPAASALPEIETLTPESDFTPFMQPDVAPTLRNQAVRMLFTDKHFNVMDRLDTYIDDYTDSAPFPQTWIDKLARIKAESEKRLLEGGEPAQLESPGTNPETGDAPTPTPTSTEAVEPPIGSASDTPVHPS